MITTVRPRKIFDTYRAPVSERIVSLKLPWGVHSDLFLLETGILLTLMRASQARRIFEFGTFAGATTLNLALNLPADSELFTLDIDGAIVPEQIADPECLNARRTVPCCWEGFPESAKIRTLIADSVKVDLSAYFGTMDLVFVDGGHDYITVKSDTENAFRMLRPDKLSFIVWHDFRWPEGKRLNFPGVDRLIEEMSHAGRDFLHVEETLFAIHASDPDGLWKPA